MASRGNARRRDRFARFSRNRSGRTRRKSGPENLEDQHPGNGSVKGRLSNFCPKKIAAVYNPCWEKYRVKISIYGFSCERLCVGCKRFVFNFLFFLINWTFEDPFTVYLKYPILKRLLPFSCILRIRKKV